MIRFLQKLRKSVAAATGRRNFEETLPAEEHSLISKVIWDWPEGEPVRVDVALARYPQLLDTPRGIVEVAIAEFEERKSAGEELSATDFAERFPEVRSQLLDSLVFEKALQEMTCWFQRVLAPKADDVQWPAVGDQVAGFKLVEPLGSGGFSRVFVAQELGFENRKVAVKICRQATHEARTLATLTHSGIGAVHYVRQIPETGMTAICMPLTSRSTLNDVLRRSAGRSRRPTSASVVWDEIRSRNKIEAATPAWADKTFAAWAQDLMLSLAEALAASHAQNIVHCDLKPTNVLVTPEGKPTLVDFNVAFRQNAVASPANVGGHCHTWPRNRFGHLPVKASVRSVRRRMSLGSRRQSMNCLRGNFPLVPHRPQMMECTCSWSSEGIVPNRFGRPTRRFHQSSTS
jgi:tRNA A-37 threonylcarbamoyl transferase component Bud32